MLKLVTGLEHQLLTKMLIRINPGSSTLCKPPGLHSQSS